MFHLFGLLAANRNTCEGARDVGKPNSGETRKGNQPAEKIKKQAMQYEMELKPSDPRKKEKTCNKIKVS